MLGVQARLLLSSQGRELAAQIILSMPRMASGRTNLHTSPSTRTRPRNGTMMRNTEYLSIGEYIRCLDGGILGRTRTTPNGEKTQRLLAFGTNECRYWWSLNQGPNTTDQTYEYHLKTYGPNVVYDDFIQNFTADAWDPKEWVDLFADAGANYFVQVSKHHDGYAVFDLPENVTKRTSVARFPHRNLLQVSTRLLICFTGLDIPLT